MQINGFIPPDSKSIYVTYSFVYVPEYAYCVPSIAAPQLQPILSLLQLPTLI